ncbi:hypothetical protein CesoFtcFv8_013259 [Champsocephalus esox]|uniref:Uncharacterized protein n=1 Tax=Champsocephalus esox TaxID=159716 RepID=A0AAN8GYP7_9TELE|nr:hypothetical protein CesoFtcFv8_013259 [Champsocephalus esox]
MGARCSRDSSNPRVKGGFWGRNRRERIPKMTSRLRRSRERLGRGEKKERERELDAIYRILTQQIERRSRLTQRITHGPHFGCLTAIAFLEM